MSDGRWITNATDDRIGIAFGCELFLDENCEESTGCGTRISAPFFEVGIGERSRYNVLCPACALKHFGVTPPGELSVTTASKGLGEMPKAVKVIDAQGRACTVSPEAVAAAFVPSTIDVALLARALFDVSLMAEAERIAEVDPLGVEGCGDCKLLNPCARHQAAIERVLDVMWSKTKAAERGEAEARAEAVVERMGRR